MTRRHKTFTVLLSILVCVFAQVAEGATITATSCAQAAVQSAISSAADGDIVAVPGGNCSWGSFSITKGIHLRGAGAGITNITVTGSISIRKHATRNVELSEFSFTKSGGGNAAKMFVVDGAWSSAPPLIHDNVFTVSNAAIFRYETNGGVIYGNTFRGNLDDSALQHKIDGDTESWSSADTMGTRDTGGTHNLYVENNEFRGMANQATDFDDAARVVFRRNTLVNSSFNSHGLDTSPIGVRHYEIYDNNFTYPDNTVNQSWQIWLRGGTGVIYGNTVSNLIGQQWGDKTELLLSVRSVMDGGVLGCCTSYPCPHQVGQNHNGSNQFTDPVRLWNNIGTLAWELNDSWSNTCGQTMSNYLQQGRDFVLALTAKPGYSAYPYPHPLRTVRPMAPQNMTVIP